MRLPHSFFALAPFIVGICAAAVATPSAPQPAAFDYAAIRGANYCAAGGHHVEHWLNYDPKETARDLDYARKVNLNQVRVFLSYTAYLKNKDAFRRNLLDLARACQVRGIGLMPVVSYKAEMPHESAPWPLSRAWVQDLIETLGPEPALTVWDVFNEPDYPPTNPARAEVMAYARVMAQLFHELGSRTPVTIGYAYENSMEENGDVVDVLSFHDYSPTGDDIRSQIDAAVRFATKVGKPVINTEIGCTARANPYDVAIEEYSRAHVGFYIWELMITKRWGDVHGIFYPDGTIRDPSIPAALLGLYRNRGPDAVREFPDREGWVTRTVADGRKWLSDANASYADGLKVAETAANLLEANELVAMRDLPSRRVAQLRAGPPSPTALRELLATLLDELAPWQKAAQ